jgi:glycosyltransferase
LKISIITVVYNNLECIETAIMSVANQTHPDVEYIVIDGNSSDGTLELIKKHSNVVDILVSENDKGIYDALNKGISLASGDVIGFLHSDDTFYSEDVLSSVAGFFSETNCDGLYANLLYVSGSNVVRDWVTSEFGSTSLLFGWMPPHPTLYLKAKVYREIGDFSLHYKISADYDFIHRLFSSMKFDIRHFRAYLVKMSIGGASNASFKNIVKKMKEDYAILNFYYKIPLFTLLCKNFRKVSQFLIRKS